MMKKGVIISLLMLSVLLGGCFGKVDDPIDSVVAVDEVGVSFANDFTSLSFSSKGYDEMAKFVGSHRDLMTDDAFEDGFDFSDVAVMNMFRDEGAVVSYEVIETFVEDGLVDGKANVVVLSKVTHLYAAMEDTHGDGDFHSESEVYFDRTVVDIYRFDGGKIVDVERVW